MIIVTDNTALAKDCFPHEHQWGERNVATLEPAVRDLARALFTTESVMVAKSPGGEYWDYLFAVNHAGRSQYDVLADLTGAGMDLPGRVLCCAGGGDRFHGFKGRSWQACRGNIHLSAYVEPGRKIDGGAAGFIVAAVVAALQATDAMGLPKARAGIKWVNDVLVDGAKVGGVLARLQTQSGIVKSAVVGIGLNVEKRPQVERDPYVPAVAALADFAADPARCRHVDLFPRLVEFLGQNIAQLCEGGFDRLLETYREHSVVLDRYVTIREEKSGAAADIIARGRVRSIGRQLELYIEGHPCPVTKGRLVLD